MNASTGQNLNKIADILKVDYLPALKNQLGIEPSPFLEKIKKTHLTANDIEMAAPIGINGGFGFGAEGIGTPAAGEQRYAKFKLSAVDMYVDIQISDKTIKLGASNNASMIDALDAEVKGSYAAGKWNIGRSLFGDGSGVLANITTVSGNTITLDSVNNVIEGLIIDLYAKGAETPTTTQLRVLSVDRAEKRVRLSDAPGSVAEGFITVQNSYKRELCGLGAIFNDSITELYGLKKEDNPFIKPMEVDAGGELTDIIFHKGVRDAHDVKNASIDMIMCGDDAFAVYQQYMRDSNVVVVDKMNFQGGAVGYKVLVGNREVCVVNERFVPAGEAWGVDTTSFELKQTDWDFSDASGMFTLIPGTSIHRALLCNYGNLISKNPGGCVKFVNCGKA